MFTFVVSIFGIRLFLLIVVIGGLLSPPSLSLSLPLSRSLFLFSLALPLSLTLSLSPPLSLTLSLSLPFDHPSSPSSSLSFYLLFLSRNLFLPIHVFLSPSLNETSYFQSFYTNFSILHRTPPTPLSLYSPSLYLSLPLPPPLSLFPPSLSVNRPANLILLCKCQPLRKPSTSRFFFIQRTFPHGWRPQRTCFMN